MYKNYDPTIEIYSACSADLMSDVMAFSKSNALLLTGLINPQVIRTAEMMDIKAVIFARGKNPGKHDRDGRGKRNCAYGNRLSVVCSKWKTV